MGFALEYCLHMHELRIITFSKKEMLYVLSGSAKEKKYAAILALIHVVLSFYSDTTFFISYQNHIPLILLLKAVLYVVLFCFWYGITTLITGSNRQIRHITAYAIPCFLLLLIYVFRYHSMQLAGDEYNIYTEAVQYNLFPYHFTYFTGALYAISFMIFPFPMGAVLVKLIVQSLVCGYCVDRFVTYFGKKGMLIYLVFVLSAVLENGILAHRMQFYALLYLWIIVKLTFDFLEKKIAGRSELLLCMLCFAVLGMWRKEGIYLLLGAPILICLAYNIKHLKKVLSVSLCYLLVFALLYCPELVFGKEFRYESYHTSMTWFVHMSRKGLDHEKYPQEIAEIDRFLSVDTVNRLNEHLGDENYRDNYSAWMEGYVGFRENATDEDLAVMEKAVARLVFQEPFVFLKTRVGIWLFGAGTIDFSSLRAFLMSAGKNLNIPLIALIAVCFYGLIKREWLPFFTAGMLLANLVLTTLLSPAAYFKYYYHQFIIGWMYIVFFVLLLSAFMNRNKLYVKEVTE